MTLTTEQKQAIKRGEAVEATVDGMTCVLLSLEVYDRVRVVLEEAPSDLATARMIRDAMVEDDAADPLLDSYQIYKEKP